MAEQVIQIRPASAAYGCSQCGNKEADVAEVGEEDYYDSHTAWLCRPCLIDALGAFAVHGLDPETEARWAHAIKGMLGFHEALRQSRFGNG